MHTLIFLLLTSILGHGECHGKSPQNINKSIKLTGDWQDKIFGGIKAKKGEFPYVAALLARNTDSHKMVCTASIIDERWILTAAHCLDRENIDDGSSLSVAVGEVIVSRNNSVFPVENVYLHPQFNKSYINISIEKPEDVSGITDEHLKHGKKQVFLNDIGLAKLKDKLTWSRYIAPIRLGSVDDDSHVNVVVTGYGAEYYEDNRDVRSLNYASLRTIRFKTCAERYHWAILIVQEMQFCATNGTHQTPYKGDSGGPLVDPRSGRQVGVTSFGITVGYPAGFTRISHFVPWIRNVTGLTLED